MPRGTHPNSLANLKKGHRFDEETARSAGAKGTATKQKRRSMLEHIGENLTPEKREELSKVFAKQLEKGDGTFWKLYLEYTEKKPGTDVNVNAEIKQNPLEGMTTDELRELIKSEE